MTEEDTFNALRRPSVREMDVLCRDYWDLICGQENDEALFWQYVENTGWTQDEFQAEYSRWCKRLDGR